MVPDFLVIGHAAKDLHSDGYRLGGTVTYAAVTARMLGLRPAVVTSASRDDDLAPLLPGVQLHVKQAPETTTFVNEYRSGRRVQRLLASAGNVAGADVPVRWREAPLVLLGPLIGELDGGIAACFPSSTVVASLQGWLRRVDSQGAVSPGAWSGKGLLTSVSAAVVSHEDVCDEAQIEEWKSQTPVLIVTEGSGGARVYLKGQCRYVPAFPAREVDPTGAGDVFAAAYLVRYRQTGDPIRSATFAACAASFSVEAHGTLGIPTKARLDERLAASGRPA